MSDGIVMFLRLKNGDDLVSECYEYQDDHGRYFVLINPLKALYMTSSRGIGYMQVAFMPWVYPKLSRTQEFSIYDEEVLLYQEASEYMEEYYWNSIEQLTSVPEEKEPIDEMEETREKIRQVLEELGLDDPEKKVYH
jgi:hypothetical protein